MAKETYNGYTNYETWLFNLYYGESFAEELRQLKHENDLFMDVYDVREMLEDYWSDVLEEQAEGWNNQTLGITDDILQMFTDKVNWHELAKQYLEEINPS